MYFHETFLFTLLAPLPFYQKIAVGALSGKAEAKISSQKIILKIAKE